MNGSDADSIPAAAVKGQRGFNLARLFPTGSLPWLLAWEALMRFRDYAAGRGRWSAIWTMLGLAALAHALVFGLMWIAVHERRPPPAEALRPVVALLALVVLLLAVMQGLALTLRVLFQSRDLTLALTSPVAFSRLLTARVISLVIANLGLSGLMLLPIANCGALLGAWHWLLLYPLTLAFAAIGVGVALLLIRPVLHYAGPRAARRILQVIQFAIPIAYVTWTSLRRAGGVDNPQPQTFGNMPDVALWLSGAVYGEVVPLMVIMVAGLGLLALGRWGIDDVVRRLLLDTEPQRIWRSSAQRGVDDVKPFRGGLVRVILVKEWRAILRDSRQLVQVAGQPLMLAAGMFPLLMLAKERGPGTVALLVYIACQLAQLLGNLTINGEEAPGLIGAAPVPRAQVLLAKSIAALVPVLGMTILAALVFGAHSLTQAAIVAFSMLGGSLSVVVLILARPRPVDRRSFLHPVTRQRSDILDVLGVLVLEVGWSAAAYWLCQGRWIGAALVLVVLLLPLFQWLRDSQREEILGY